ncbi:MAG: cation transporter [Anaerolineales bacterium]
MTESSQALRVQAQRRGQWLTWATMVYNSLEGVLSLGAGFLAGSVALVGFGVDSFIEVAAGWVALWRLGVDRDPVRRAFAERWAGRAIGVSFLALAAYLAVDGVRSLWVGDEPHASVVGIVIAAISLVIMPLLARAKRQVAKTLSSEAIRAESVQTDICAYLSAILLGGLGLHALFGWWWADSIAALAMTPFIAWEGVEGVLGRGGHEE